MGNGEAVGDNLRCPLHTAWLLHTRATSPAHSPFGPQSTAPSTPAASSPSATPPTTTRGAAADRRAAWRSRPSSTAWRANAQRAPARTGPTRRALVSTSPMDSPAPATPAAAQSACHNDQTTSVGCHEHGPQRGRGVGPGPKVPPPARDVLPPAALATFVQVVAQLCQGAPHNGPPGTPAAPRPPPPSTASPASQKPAAAAASGPTARVGSTSAAATCAASATPACTACHKCRGLPDNWRLRCALRLGPVLFPRTTRCVGARARVRTPSRCTHAHGANACTTAVT